MGKNNAKITDIQTYIQAGINPKTGLPVKYDDAAVLKDNIRKNLRILDEQDAINRYVWYNLPSGLDGQLLERILYYRAQGMFFYMETDEKFYFLPYALAGTIDVYGRFKSVTPLPFNGKNSTEDDKAWITGLVKNVKYDISDIDYSDFLDGCVILTDYSNQTSQTNIPRQLLMDPVLDAMAESIPFARTNLIANSGIRGMRVGSEDDKAQVELASQSMTQAALQGDPLVPFVGQIEFQDFTSQGSPLKSEEYLLYMQAMDNFRLSLHGLKNGGLFQKKSHMLESEQEMNDGNIGLVYQDGLTNRQKFCNLVNAIWGLGIWCEPAEQVIGADRNGDAVVGNDAVQQGDSTSTNNTITENENGGADNE